MKKKLGRGYTPKSVILSNWVQRGTLGKCPNCTLHIIRIIDTGKSRLYYHAETIICVVAK